MSIVICIRSSTVFAICAMLAASRFTELAAHWDLTKFVGFIGCCATIAAITFAVRYAEHRWLL